MQKAELIMFLILFLVMSSTGVAMNNMLRKNKNKPKSPVQLSKTHSTHDHPNSRTTLCRSCGPPPPASATDFHQEISMSRCDWQRYSVS